MQTARCAPPPAGSGTPTTAVTTPGMSRTDSTRRSPTRPAGNWGVTVMDGAPISRYLERNLSSAGRGRDTCEYSSLHEGSVRHCQ